MRKLRWLATIVVILALFVGLYGKLFEAKVSAVEVDPTVSPDPTHELTPSPTEEPNLSPSVSPTPSPTPTYSCCEKDIKVTEVKVNPQETDQNAVVNGILISIEWDLKLSWKCDKVEDKDCLAYYEVVLENSNWQEFKDGKWVDLAEASVEESIIPDRNDKLKSECDGKYHTGTWSYTYFAKLKTKNKVRNTSLIFDWDVPANKGRSYHSEYTVEGVSGTTGTKPPTVKGSHPKQK